MISVKAGLTPRTSRLNQQKLTEKVVPETATTNTDAAKENLTNAANTVSVNDIAPATLLANLGVTVSPSTAENVTAETVDFAVDVENEEDVPDAEDFLCPGSKRRGRKRAESFFAKKDNPEDYYFSAFGYTFIYEDGRVKRVKDDSQLNGKINGNYVVIARIPEDI